MSTESENTEGVTPEQGAASTPPGDAVTGDTIAADTVAADTMAASVAAPGEESAPPQNLLIAEPVRYTRQLVTIYTILAVVMTTALVALVFLVVRPGHESSAAWSSWKPQNAGVGAMTKEIADHVASTYRMTESGGQLLSVLPTDASITNGGQKVPLRFVAVRKKPQSNDGIRVLTTDNTRLYILCGLGKNCSIDGGKASQTRGRLVRREALEAALYTFKFVPSVDTVLAYMPPGPNAAAAQVLFLEKDALKEELKQPLDKTLTAKTTPLPDAEDLGEAATIDKLTLKHIFDYEYQPVETGGALVILNPSK